MSNFPIANLIRSGRTPESLDGDNNIVEMINWNYWTSNKVAYFDLSTASELYWLGRKDYYTLNEDWGPLRAPFPTIWAEWKIPDEIIIHGKMEETHGCRMAALVECIEVNTSSKSFEHFAKRVRADKGRPIPALDPMPLSLIIWLIILDDTDPATGPIPYFIPVGKQLLIDPKTGRYIDLSAVDLIPQAVSDSESGRYIVDMADVNPVLMALNLMNCRNVQMRQTGAVYARSGTEKRRGVQPVRYNTIVLPGTTFRGKGRGVKHDREMSAHRVRGHFKTFTADKPLLGKHVGTYWWGWQVRGNAERGQVLSDYKMGETA